MTGLDEQLRRRLKRIPGLMEGESAFGDGPAFWLDRKQITNVVAPGAIELRLTRALISTHRERLRADARVELRRGRSDWLTVRYATARDLDLVVELANIAADAHRPPEGAPLRPPPSGVEMERRRRFH